MRVQVTLDFLPPTGGMTPAAFLKWLTGNLEDHFRDEHEWDQEICPELAAVHAVIEAFSNEPRLEAEEPRDEEWRGWAFEPPGSPHGSASGTACGFCGFCGW